MAVATKTADKSSAVERHTRAQAQLAAARAQAQDAQGKVKAAAQQLADLAAHETAAAQKRDRVRELVQQLEAEAVRARAAALIDDGTPESAASEARVADVEARLAQGREQLTAAEQEASTVVTEAASQHVGLQAQHDQHQAAHGQAVRLVEALSAHTVDAQRAARQEVHGAIADEYGAARARVDAARRELAAAYSDIQRIGEAVPARMAAYRLPEHDKLREARQRVVQLHLQEATGAAKPQENMHAYTQLAAAEAAAAAVGATDMPLPSGNQLRAVEVAERSRDLLQTLEAYAGHIDDVVNPSDPKRATALWMCVPGGDTPALRDHVLKNTGGRDVAGIVGPALGWSERALGEHEQK